MNKLVQQILNLSTTDDDLKKLVSYLNEQQDNILKNQDHIDPTLDTLAISHQTYAYMFLLHVKSTLHNIEPIIFIEQSIALIHQGSIKQIRLDTKKFRTICKRFLNKCVEIHQPMRAIKPLREAILKVAPEREDHITPQHYMFVLSCIKSKCYKAALPYLELKNSFTIENGKTGIESVDVRLFYYYGGIVYTALKKYQHAQEFFLNVVSFPAFITSEIMVEAYKKFVLVSLLFEGTVPSISRFSGHGFIRLVKQKCAAYEDLATAYSTQYPEEVKKNNDCQQ